MTKPEQPVTRPTIYQAFVAACAEVENVARIKDGQVGNQKYKYATLEAVLAMLHPVLVKNRLAVAQYVDGDKLRTTVFHEDGESLKFGAYNLGAMGKHQERGSAITYGRRYMLCSIFGVAQEDDDAASADAPPVKDSLFKNSATRKAYGDSVIKMIDGACNQSELNQTYKDNAGKLIKMRDGHEYDALMYDELMQRFARKKNQLIDEDARVEELEAQLAESEQRGQ